MHFVVADLELVLGHAERDDEADGRADGGGDDGVPRDDEPGADDLLQELDAADAAVDAAARVGDGEEEGAQDGLGEEAGGGAAEEAGDGMGVEDAERVVDVLKEGPSAVHHHHGEPGDAPGQDPHHHGSPALDQS